MHDSQTKFQINNATQWNKAAIYLIWIVKWACKLQDEWFPNFVKIDTVVQTMLVLNLLVCFCFVVFLLCSLLLFFRFLSFFLSFCFFLICIYKRREIPLFEIFILKKCNIFLFPVTNVVNWPYLITDLWKCRTFSQTV